MAPGTPLPEGGGYLLPHLPTFGVMRLRETYGFIYVPTHHNSPSYAPDHSTRNYFVKTIINLNFFKSGAKLGKPSYEAIFVLMKRNFALTVSSRSKLESQSDILK